MDAAVPVAEQKRLLREEAHARRNAQVDKDSLSEQICDRFFSLPECSSAKTILFYADVRAEVRTRQSLPRALASGKKIVVPYCIGGELELFHLENVNELSPGMYRILEPSEELRALPTKRVDPAEIDLAQVPGVAFDRNGGRLGHGKGYYDRLLQRCRPEATLAALAFECQLFPKIPMSARDVFMNYVVTESAVYRGGRNRP